MIQHQFRFLQIDHRSLGVHRAALGIRILPTQPLEFFGAIPRFLNFPVQHAAHLTVNLQIRISTNRRGKVAIGRKRQSEMPFVPGGIARLLETAEHLARQYARQSVFGDVLQGALHITGLNITPIMNAQAKRRQ